MSLTKVTYSMIDGAVINVLDFGAVGDGLTDDTAAIQAALDFADENVDTVTGGIIYFPRGRYLISATLNVKTTHIDGLASLTLVGEGLHNTVIQAKSGFTGSSMIDINNQTYCGVKQLHLLGDNNVNNGVRIFGGSHHTLDCVFAQKCNLYGFSFEANFMLTMTGCRAKTCQTGFNFAGFHTSLFVSNCYALNNTATGYTIVNTVYSSFNACASDTNRTGYFISNVGGVEFIACGAEDCQRAAFYLYASAANDATYLINGTRCTLTQCFATECDTAGLGYGSIYTEQVDTSVIESLVDRFFEYNVTGAVSVTSNNITLNHNLELRNCKFTGTTYGVGLTPRETCVTKKNGVSITAPSTPVCDLKSVFGSSTQYSGVLHVWAGNAEPQTTTLFNGAAYVLLVTKSSSTGSAVTLISSNGLTAGAAANHPSFTWTLDTVNNKLLASPVASTTGTFYFQITQLGSITTS